MYNIKPILNLIPRMTYEEHELLVNLELFQYFTNVLNGRIPANEYEIRFADYAVDRYVFGRDIDKDDEEVKQIGDEFDKHADFNAMRHYFSPIVLSFFPFPDYDEETNDALERFHKERYPEHCQTKLSQKD